LLWTRVNDGGYFSCRCGYKKYSHRKTCPNCGQPMYYAKAVGPEGDMGSGRWCCDGCGHRM
jgi:hypothetical protein